MYGESDVETNNNTLKAEDNYNLASRRYLDLSLPTVRKANQPDSAKLLDLNATKHRRSSSDTSKDKQAGAYVHVKGKRKAPAPPQSNTNPRTLSPKSSLARKKRPAPKPPTRELEEATASSTSLLEDKEIRALIEGTAFASLSTPLTTSIPSEMERKAYVSPYLKIREDRKLTDEQKRMLIDQVSQNVRKNEERNESPLATKRSTPDIFTIERGQLVYQGSESPKLPRKDEKLTAPSSPISPRPWFKRQSSSHKEASQTALKPIERRKPKSGEKEPPENGTSRNSFFGAGRFNIFARMSEDSKKKERDAEKRKSQIGIPNISELDREAAEIIQRGHEMEAKKKLSASEMFMLRTQNANLREGSTEDEDRPRSAKDLISKFEADTSKMNRVTLNPAFMGRQDFFGECFSSDPKQSPRNELRIEEERRVPVKQREDSPRKKEESTFKSKLPQIIRETNGIRKQNDLMGLWTCPYCTLQNPNWKIICEACEKIKPYEKRFMANGELVRSNGTPPKGSPPKSFSSDAKPKDNVWDKKTDQVLKYFNPPVPNGLAKSSSETAIVKSLKRKSPSPSRIAGSPKAAMRRNFFKTHSEDQDSQIDAIEEEVLEEKTLTTKPPRSAQENAVSNSPNLSEMRSARLAKFNLFPNFKRQNLEDDRMNAINTNRRPSPEKKFPDKLDFSDPVALELEKERLREKIRAMNAKALNEKYPVLKKLPENIVVNQVTIEPVPTAPPRTPESSRLGAIRKTFKNAFETRRGSFEKEKNDEKILNKESLLLVNPVGPTLEEATASLPLPVFGQIDTPKAASAQKTEKISTSIQTTLENKKTDKSKRDSGLLPTTLIDLTKDAQKVERKVGLSTKQQEEVEEISGQLKSRDGIETFKATLRSKSINKTNTLAINKILRDLENAIADGKYDDAAQLAMDLAKMKVSLSVTRQRDRPKSDIDINLKNVR